MIKIYKLKSDVTNFCSFIEVYPTGQESMIGRAMDQDWREFGDDYTPVTLKQCRSDTGKKIFNLILVVCCLHFLCLVRRL